MNSESLQQRRVGQAEKGVGGAVRQYQSNNAANTNSAQVENTFVVQGDGMGPPQYQSRVPVSQVMKKGPILQLARSVKEIEEKNILRRSEAHARSKDYVNDPGQITVRQEVSKVPGQAAVACQA